MALAGYKSTDWLNVRGGETTGKQEMWGTALA